MKKMVNFDFLMIWGGYFLITIRYKIPTKDQFLKRGGGGQENFGQKLKF